MNIIKKRISQSYYTLTAILGYKKEDIFLVSFPKSGNTWVKFFLLNLLTNSGELKADSSFKTLDETIPELSRDNLLKKWKFKIIPRFVKSHLSYQKIFFKNNKALLVVRDPRDVMVSFFLYVKNNFSYDFKGDFSEFIRDKAMGLEACILHQISWKNSGAVIIRFEDLKTNGAEVLENALSTLDISVPKQLIKSAFDDASFEKMKIMESRPKKYTHTHKESYTFVRKGEKNQWQSYFSEADIDYYNSLLNNYKKQYTDFYEQN
jgi:estrone sulfotransferase